MYGRFNEPGFPNELPQVTLREKRCNFMVHDLGDGKDHYLKVKISTDDMWQWSRDLFMLTFTRHVRRTIPAYTCAPNPKVGQFVLTYRYADCFENVGTVLDTSNPLHSLTKIQKCTNSRIFFPYDGPKPRQIVAQAISTLTFIKWRPTWDQGKVMLQFPIR